MNYMFAGALVVSSAMSCAAVPQPGSRASDWGYDSLAAQVEFDHACPAERIRLIQYDGSRSADLDVCGVVRRYKSFGGGRVGQQPTLVDVTSLYPASALPAPLPPDTAGASVPSSGSRAAN